MKNPMPTKRILELNILPTRDEMGKMAAGDVAQAMNRFIKERGSVNIVFAAAPSQDEFLVHLAKKRNIDWSRVTCFHLDDYVDLPRNHPKWGISLAPVAPICCGSGGQGRECP